MRIAFFGTSDFGLPALRALNAGPGVQVAVTTRERPKGRGLSLQPSPVKSAALELRIEVLEPDNPNQPEFIAQLVARQPDLVVLAAYRFILTPEILAIPKLGCVNLHPSLLPRYRGAAPIQRAIMNGETQTGVSVFLMNEKIDQGNVIFQRPLTIGDNEKYGELSARLADLSADALLTVLPQVERGNFTALTQDPGLASYAHKIQKDERLIHWNLIARQVHNLIRALSPAPAAYTWFRGRRLEILGSECLDDVPGEPGRLQAAGKRLLVGTAGGSLLLTSVKPEGGRVISGADLINGRRIETGEKLTENP
jgi:methionyl-tRNA formyltransferase